MSARNILILALVGILALGGGNALAETVAHRADNWAIPLAVNAGLPNLNRVNAALYRSAQPSQKGLVFLSTFPILVKGDRPIKTILSLRAFHNDAPLLPSSAALHLEQIRFNTWHPEDEDVVKFLRIVTTPSSQPVLVHS